MSSKQQQPLRASRGQLIALCTAMAAVACANSGCATVQQAREFAAQHPAGTAALAAIVASSIAMSIQIDRSRSGCTAGCGPLAQAPAFHGPVVRTGR